MNENQIPQKLYLSGGGRSRMTRELRRKNRFPRRVFTIGGLPIRPGRFVDVNFAFVAKHFDEIVARVRTGTLLVTHDHDHCVDEDELRAMLAFCRGEEPPAKAEEPPPGDEEDEPKEPEAATSDEVEGVEPGADFLEEESVEEPVDLEEPFEAAAEEPVDLEEPEVENRWLPDGWELKTKREMLALCEERGIAVDGKPSNDKLIEMLKGWLAGA